MRIAGFNLGARFTMDDFDTASDIIKGNIKISLGSLEEDTEAEEREEARLEMLEELKGLRDEIVKNKVVEKEVPVEVGALTSSIDEKNGDTVEEFSTSDIRDNEGQINIGDNEFKSNTNEKEQNIEEDDAELGDIDDIDFDEDAFEDNDEHEDYDSVPDIENPGEDADDTEEGEDDDEFFPISFDEDDEEQEETEDTIDSEQEESYEDSIQSELDKELAKYLTNTVENVGVDNSKPAVDNSKHAVDKKPQGVDNSAKAEHRTPIKTDSSTGTNKVVTPVRKVQDIKIPDIKPKTPTATPKANVHKTVSKKVDYSELSIKEINDKYLRKFMLDNGVRKAPVKAELLKKEFGEELVRSFTTRGYIMRRGNGYIMGI